jgi:hypothetical protein
MKDSYFRELGSLAAFSLKIRKIPIYEPGINYAFRQAWERNLVQDTYLFGNPDRRAGDLKIQV